MIRKFFYIVALVVYVAASSSAYAESAPVLYYKQSQVPESIAARQVAMLYGRLAGKVPDFDDWAQQLQLNAPTDDMTYVPETARSLRTEFDLIGSGDPITVVTPIQLSPYSQANGGYIVDGFKDDTYFSFKFLKSHYAVIAQGLGDRQWMAADEQQMSLIERAKAEREDGIVLAVIILRPRSADPLGTLALDNIDHYLVSATIDKIQIYAPTSGMPVWESNEERPKDVTETDPELLNLYQ